MERYTKMNHKYGSTLRKARNAAGLTQSELAQCLGCTTTWISQLETDYRPVNMKNGIAIAKACGCTFLMDSRGLHLA